MLRSCNNCPKYKVPTIESDESIHLPKIKFHIYKVFTIYSKYGVVGPENFLCGVCSNSIHLEKQKNL